MSTLLRAKTTALALRERLRGEVDDLEVVVDVRDRTTQGIEGDRLVPELEASAWSIAMRALRGGRVASAASASSSVDDAAFALRRALSAAQPEPLEAFAETPEVEADDRNFDPRVARLVDEAGRVRALALGMMQATRKAAPGAVQEGAVSVARSASVVLTGRGGPCAWESTRLEAFMMLDGADWDVLASPFLPQEVEILGLGKALAASLPEKAVTCSDWLGGPRELAVVLHPRLLEAVLRGLFVERVGGDRVVSGLSRAVVGDRVAASSITLVDDTGAAGSVAGAPVDDEGTPGARKTLVERGVLKSLLLDRRSAAVLGGGLRSTGNGFRLPLLAEDRAEAPVRVGMGHLELAPGDVPRAALVPGRTVMVTNLLGLHTANKATGAFNNPVLGGVALEDGVPVARLVPGAWALSGTLDRLLREAVAVSREVYATGSATLPWLAFPAQVA